MFLKKKPKLNFSNDELIFDNHMHILSIRNICISAYLSRLTKNTHSEALALAASRDYIYFDMVRNFEQTLAILSIIESEAGRAIEIYEKDLRGEFEKRNFPPVLKNGEMSIESHRFKKMVICPLLIDFNYPHVLQSNAYNIAPEHKIDEQAAALVRAMQDYQLENPNGFFIIRPYIGINPAFKTAGEIESFFQRYFSNFSAKASDAISAWQNVRKAKLDANASLPNIFGGIKIYPPLDCNPNPDDADIRAKFDMVFDICEKRGIPIVTHCDDQGFRIVELEKSQTFTSPQNWEKVLRKFPNIYLDFAHFGRQYTKSRPLAPISTDWMRTILRFISEYPHVYADVSFNAFEREFWQIVEKNAKSLRADDFEKFQSRVLFGTDWPLSLTKVETASEYWRTFISYKLFDGLKFKMLNENPRAFGFRD